jgi:hypothetical protein
MVFRLGILFSMILMGIVMLYLRKKEKWDWDKILILFMVTIVCISIVGGMGIVAYVKMSAKPEIQTSFWDINLSTQKSTVEFIKGQPDRIHDGDIWIYISEVLGAPEVYLVGFSKDRLRFIGYLGGELNRGPRIQGIKNGSHLDDVIAFFGKPSHISESKDKPAQLYSYDDYHVFFVIEDDRVSGYGIYDPEQGPMKIEYVLETAMLEKACVLPSSAFISHLS